MSAAGVTPGVAGTLADEVRGRLAVLAASDIDLRDDSHRHVGHAGSNGGGHLLLRIVSTRFEGLGTVARHRLVYACVADLMPARLHALAITAQTPAEVHSAAHASPQRPA